MQVTSFNLQNMVWPLVSYLWIKQRSRNATQPLLETSKIYRMTATALSTVHHVHRNLGSTKDMVNLWDYTYFLLYQKQILIISFSRIVFSFYLMVNLVQYHIYILFTVRPVLAILVVISSYCTHIQFLPTKWQVLIHDVPRVFPCFSSQVWAFYGIFSGVTGSWHRRWASLW